MIPCKDSQGRCPIHKECQWDNSKRSNWQREGFLSMLLGILDASLLWTLFTGKQLKARLPRKETIRAGGGTITGGEDFHEWISSFN